MQLHNFFLALIVLLFIGCESPKSSNEQTQIFIDTAKSFKKEIPIFDDGKYDLFYLLAKNKQKQLGLDSIENGFDNLQIRVWYEFSRVLERRLVIITNKDTAWTATVYNMKVISDEIISKEIIQMTPKSGWPYFVKKLLDLKIVTLPSMVNIVGDEGGKDGKTFNVEVATKNQYRFYTYWEPHDYQNKFWQAKNMAEIIDLLKTELNVEN